MRTVCDDDSIGSAVRGGWEAEATPPCRLRSSALRENGCRLRGCKGGEILKVEIAEDKSDWHLSTHHVTTAQAWFYCVYLRRLCKWSERTDSFPSLHRGLTRLPVVSHRITRPGIRRRCRDIKGICRVPQTRYLGEAMHWSHIVVPSKRGHVWLRADPHTILGGI